MKKKVVEAKLTHIAVKEIKAQINNKRIDANYGDLLTLTQDEAAFLKHSVLPITKD